MPSQFMIHVNNDQENKIMSTVDIYETKNTNSNNDILMKECFMRVMLGLKRDWVSRKRFATGDGTLYVNSGLHYQGAERRKTWLERHACLSSIAGPWLLKAGNIFVGKVGLG